MIRFSSFTPRMWLILVHDLLATAAAVVASFFIRFEEGGLVERWRLLAILLPGFVLYAAFVYGISGLYKAKWRFTSLPDLYNIMRAATVLAATLLALDYVLLRAIESGAVMKIRPVGILSPSAADRGQAIRGISVLGDPDDIESVIADLRNRGVNLTRLVLTPSALAPEAKPETILMRARRL